jgi:deoxycytidylate deaminase
MDTTIQASGTDDRPELIFALVGFAGAPLDDLSTALKTSLKTFNYQPVDIRISDLLVNVRGITVQDQQPGECGRIRYLQQKGDAFRDKLKKGDPLARAAITAIRTKRAESGSPDKPLAAHAYILRQLKRPEEVDLLRHVYGSAFVLIGGHAPRSVRIGHLASLAAENDPEATQVINVDEKEHTEFGQNTQDTYPKADFFANLHPPGTEAEVERFVELLFGHPLHTPSPDEYAMYQARAASLRSSDDNRQVGAVIVRHGQDIYRKDADVIAVGTNEVPRAGGGFYWDKDSPDYRDQKLLQRGEDRATKIKIDVLAELIETIKQKKWLQDTIAEKDKHDIARDLLPSLNRTQFLNIGEFSRPVHAEMASLIDAARRGVPVADQSMFVTTFPCHNCAKHIIAAGIKQVIYLEPYHKSRALQLYGEEIVSDWLTTNKDVTKVGFFAFTGIGPRLYEQLFSMSARGAKMGNSLKNWEERRRSLSPLYVQHNASLLYVAAERQALDELPIEVYDWDKKSVCPDLGAKTGE